MNEPREEQKPAEQNSASPPCYLLCVVGVEDSQRWYYCRRAVDWIRVPCEGEKVAGLDDMHFHLITDVCWNHDGSVVVRCDMSWENIRDELYLEYVERSVEQLRSRGYEIEVGR